MTNETIYQTALQQSAWDCGCAPEDFLKSEHVTVISKSDPRAKKFLKLPNVCDMVTYGNNVVASVSEEMLAPITEYLSDKHAERAFETPGILRLNEMLLAHGCEVKFMAQCFLPKIELIPDGKCAYGMRVLEKGEFEELYTDDFSNALCFDRKHLDVLCVAAYDGGKVIALAGCSMDGEEMWQIGVDVLPAYRRQGVACALTSRLAREIILREKVPFYTCAWANTASHKNAIRSGFRPAWSQITAGRIRM